MVTKEKEKQTKNEEKGISLSNMIGGKIQFRDIDEVLIRTIKKFGNSCHIAIPSKHEGKESQVIIWKKGKEEEKQE